MKVGSFMDDATEIHNQSSEARAPSLDNTILQALVGRWCGGDGSSGLKYWCDGKGTGTIGTWVVGCGVPGYGRNENVWGSVIESQVLLSTMAFTGRVTLFFASNSETNCRISMIFQHKAFYTPT